MMADDKSMGTRFLTVVVPHLRSICALPEYFVDADEREFLNDLLMICSDQRMTT